MGEQKRINIPFAAILLNQVAYEFQQAICMGIDRHDYAIPLIKVEDGKMLTRYEDEDGHQLHLDDAHTVQTFSVVERMRTTQGRAVHHSLGISFQMDVAFVVIGFKNCDPSTLWKGFDVFKPKKVINATACNTSGQTVNLSGRLPDQGVQIEMHPMVITQKYFPGQLAKMQRQQMSVTALEFRFGMLVENVCDLCLKYCE